jgi:hypothetical protein
MNKYKLLASQAQLVNRYKNTRSKLQKCCANIYFIKQCLAKQITPNYVNIRIASTSPAAIVTTKKAQTIRIKEKIQFPYKPVTRYQNKRCVRLNNSYYIIYNTWG